jgi:Flp pilus assembly protein TadD
MASSSSSSTAPTPEAAAAAFARGDFAAAEQVYASLLLRLLAMKPRPEPSVLSGYAVNRANCLLRISRLADAEVACRHALRLQPTSINAHKILAVTLSRMVKEGQRWRIHDEVTQ